MRRFGAAPTVPEAELGDIIGLFNWKEKKGDTISVNLDNLDLPGGPKQTYAGFDYWANEFLEPFTGTLAADLRPASCRTIALRAMRDHPQLVSTSRHITQGVVDVINEKWDPASKILSGTSLVVADDPYELRIVTPSGPRPWKATAPRVSADDENAGVTVKLAQSGPHVRATLTSKTSRKVDWTISFTK